jgi:hypothetical protein
VNTDLPTPNIPLLRKAVEWAEAEAAKTDGTCQWDQGSWMERREGACGTSYCIAGYTVAVAGHEVGAVASLCPDGCCATLTVNGEAASWTATGASLLGLPEGDAHRLFNADNTIDVVRDIAEEIAARAGERL